MESRIDRQESYKQQQEIAAWVKIRKKKGEEFMKGTVVEGDLEPYRNTVIVDVGCGPRPFVEHFPVYLGVMLDCCMRGYREKGLLQESTIESVLCAEGMGEAMPFKDGSVDHVFCINMLDHTFAPKEVVAEFERVLKPGGMVHLNVDIGGKPNPCEPVVFTREDIDELFSGLQLIHVEEKPPSNPGRTQMLIRIFRKRTPEGEPEGSPAAPVTFEAAAGVPALTRYMEILACPVCRGDLALSGDDLSCPTCERSFRNEDGIATLLAEQPES